MNIVAINGSPKPKDSLSALIIERLGRIMGEVIPTFQATGSVRGETPQEALSQMLTADVLVIVFPLYVDGLPAPLIELLTRLERAGVPGKGPRVYAVANCGFYEAHHAQLVLNMVRLFANRSGCPWGYGVGIGGGPMLNAMGEDWSRGPASEIQNALTDLARAMRERESLPDAFAVPKFPRVLYRAMAHMGWKTMAKKNKVNGKLRAKPYN